MSLPDTSPDLDDLPPSAKYVVFVLDSAGGSLPRDELWNRTELADRTFDEALTRLEDHDIVRRDRDANAGDLRFVRVELDDRL